MSIAGLTQEHRLRLEAAAHKEALRKQEEEHQEKLRQRTLEQQVRGGGIGGRRVDGATQCVPRTVCVLGVLYASRQRRNRPKPPIPESPYFPGRCPLLDPPAGGCAAGKL